METNFDFFCFLLIIITLPTYYFSFIKYKKTEVFLSKIKNIDFKTANKKREVVPNLKLVFYLLLINFSIGSFLMTGIYVYILDILKDKGIGVKEAVAIGALLGPSQVGVRILDMCFPKKTPLITAIISSLGILISFILLLFSIKIAFLAVIIFGLGNGMRSILRGTLPLWIFKPKIYATVIGSLAFLPLVFQAVTPLVGGFIINYFSTKIFVYMLCVLAALNLLPLIFLQQVLNGRKLMKINNNLLGLIKNIFQS